MDPFVTGNYYLRSYLYFVVSVTMYLVKSVSFLDEGLHIIAHVMAALTPPQMSCPSNFHPSPDYVKNFSMSVLQRTLICFFAFRERYLSVD